MLYFSSIFLSLFVCDLLLHFSLEDASDDMLLRDHAQVCQGVEVLIELKR